MTTIKHIGQQVAALAPDELANFRTWFASFDADVWDEQIAADAGARRLDVLAETAIAEHVQGQTRPL